MPLSSTGTQYTCVAYYETGDKKYDNVNTKYYTQYDGKTTVFRSQTDLGLNLSAFSY